MFAFVESCGLLANNAHFDLSPFHDGANYQSAKLGAV
jgi:hypothetical protein